MIARMQQRRGTTVEWVAANPVLAAGEVGYDTTLKSAKYGDGATTWINLPFHGGAAALKADLSYTTSGTTVALLGASLTNIQGIFAGVYDSGFTTSRYNVCYGSYTWANNLTGHRMELLKNVGIGGANTAIILSHVPDVTEMPVKPAMCIVGEIGTNDGINLTGTPITLAAVLASAEGIVAQLLAAGIRVVLQTTPPSTAFDDAPKKLLIAGVNRWIKAQGIRRGVTVADVASVLADPVTGDPIAGTTNDGTHWLDPGGQLAGEVLANAIRPMLTGSVDLASSNADPLSLTLNPTMQGTAGTLTTGVTGQVATSFGYAWTGTAGTALVSKVPRTDIPGTFWQRTQFNGGATARVLNLQQTINAGYAAGDLLRAECELVGLGDWADIQKHELSIVNYSGTTNYRADMTGYASGVPGANTVHRNPSGPMVLRTPLFTATGTETLIYLNMALIGTAGTIDIGRMRIVKVAP